VIITTGDKDVSNDKEASSGTVEVNNLFHVREILYIIETHNIKYVQVFFFFFL